MFSFKQFTIQQDRTAMKVCTDACVLGAYADVRVRADSTVADSTGAASTGAASTAAESTAAESTAERLLDIGTGTGLLALMAAQRNPMAIIDAVEVDEEAFVQAAENVAASPFAKRVSVIHKRIQDFGEGQVYDRILTNPPFYTNHLRSPNAAVNRALHTDELSFGELVEAVIRLMKPDGQWWVLLPPFEAGKLAELARQSGLYPFRKLSLRHHEQKPFFRVITGFSFIESEVSDDTLTIYELNAQSKSGVSYTPEFRSLLEDFYLIF